MITVSRSSQKKTAKQRINLSPALEDFQFIQTIAKRDNVPVAKKTMELVKFALMVEEDSYFSQLAESRLEQKSPLLSSEDFWEKAFS